MEAIITILLNVSIAIHIVLIAVCIWRIWQGENMVDRIIGLDMNATLILAVLVLIALITTNPIYIDVAIGLAALGFIGTIALARYIADHKMF
jgi:multisubunit Na+/H+ antiporter MnhF subunit